jgi:hypothetical protein
MEHPQITQITQILVLGPSRREASSNRSGQGNFEVKIPESL